MIGAIFAGGYGKRLQPLSSGTPKVLLPLKDDYLILDKQILDFKNAGINELYLLTGYKGEMIEQRYGNNWKGQNIKYFNEAEPMGTLWALNNLFQHVDSDVILRNGDTLCDLDMRFFINYSISRKETATMVIVRMRSPYGIINISRNRVTDFLEKPLLDHYINAGYYFLKQDVRTYLNRKFSEREIERTIFRSLARNGQISVYRYNGFWKSIDSVKDYEEIREMYLARDDYDFGIVTTNKSSKVYRLYVGKELRLQGKGEIKLVKGSIELTEKVIMAGHSEILNGISHIRAKAESTIKISGSLYPLF